MDTISGSTIGTSIEIAIVNNYNHNKYNYYISSILRMIISISWTIESSMQSYICLSLRNMYSTLPHKLPVTDRVMEVVIKRSHGMFVMHRVAGNICFMLPRAGWESTIPKYSNSTTQTLFNVSYRIWWLSNVVYIPRNVIRTTSVMMSFTDSVAFEPFSSCGTFWGQENYILQMPFSHSLISTNDYHFTNGGGNVGVVFFCLLYFLRAWCGAWVNCRKCEGWYFYSLIVTWYWEKPIVMVNMHITTTWLIQCWKHVDVAQLGEIGLVCIIFQLLNNDT